MLNLDEIVNYILYICLRTLFASFLNFECGKNQIFLLIATADVELEGTKVAPLC